MFLVTGSTSGVALELARCLMDLIDAFMLQYAPSEKISAAIKIIKSQVRTKIGRVESLPIGLAHLAYIEKSIRDVLSKGDRSNVLMRKSGLVKAPASSKTVDFGEYLQRYPCFHRHPTRSTYPSLH